MANNRPSHMAQRREPHTSLDDFPTQPWATRALCSFILGGVPDCHKKLAWEPTANRGYMVRPLGEYFDTVVATDIFDYGVGYLQDDFLFPRSQKTADWIITNPPFRLFEEFVLTAWERCHVGVAMFARTLILAGQDRWKTIYRPLTGQWEWWQFVERVPLFKGRVEPTKSTMTDYGWLILKKNFVPGAARPLRHIPPCRKAFERPGDYKRYP